MPTLRWRRRLWRAALFSASVGGAAAPFDTALADTAPDAVETVVVSGSPLASDPDHLATIVDSVDRDQILKRGGANLADALAAEPGVTGTSFASGASRPVIRGFDANRVRVLEDGVGSFDVSDVGPDHGVPIDPLSAERIEVVRGAATLRYGSQAIGGVVNAINNRVPTQLPDKAFAADVSAGYGTDADATQLSALADARAGQFALHADAFSRNTGDYDIPGGTESNSFFKGDGMALGSSYFFGDSHVGAGIIHYDARYGIPGEDTYIDMKQTKELVRSSFAINGDALQTLNVEGGHADYQHSERLPDGTATATFVDHESDVRSEALLGATGPLDSSAVGAQYQERSFSALGEGQDYLLPTRTQSGAVFLFTEAPLAGSAKLQGGARVERVQISGTPADDQAVQRDFTPISASLGVVLDATQTARLGLTLSSAARAPAQTELFARGPHDGPGTYETGDPDLQQERATSLEASLRLREEHYRLDASLWGAQFSNYIYGRLTGRTCDDSGVCVPGDGGELKELDYTQANARFWGAEAKSTWTLLDSARGVLETNLFADYVRATLDAGGNVPRIPPYHVGAGVDWSRERFAAGALIKYSGRQTAVADGESETGGFASVDAYTSWTLRQQPALTLSLVAHNLTDSTQRNAIALNKDEVLLPGRDLQLTVRLSL
ncbi:MAG: TonB-dependent receptor [Steroidobacteraceae bacterium]